MKVTFRTATTLHRSKLTRLRAGLRGERIEKVKPKYKRKLPRLIVGALRALLLLVSLASFAVIAVVFVPDVYYKVFPADTQPVTAYEQSVRPPTTPAPSPTPMPLPPLDTTLPEGNWLVIPRIGVRSELRATQDPEEALAKGLWHVPDFGEAGDTEMPMIVAGHRFGWQWWWKTDYWKYNSFYHLPELEVGDRVEVIAGQRKWIYEVYSAIEGEEITDYDADLILYTCKFLNSPVRYFRYAKLVPPEL